MVESVQGLPVERQSRSGCVLDVLAKQVVLSCAGQCVELVIVSLRPPLIPLNLLLHINLIELELIIRNVVLVVRRDIRRKLHRGFFRSRMRSVIPAVRLASRPMLGAAKKST